MAHERAGLPAQESDLINVDEVIAAYYDLVPDSGNPDQRVVFGTSGHRGSSLDTAFNEAHIAATTQAIVEYRASQGTTGPLFIGMDFNVGKMAAVAHVLRDGQPDAATGAGDQEATYAVIALGQLQTVRQLLTHQVVKTGINQHEMT